MASMESKALLATLFIALSVIGARSQAPAVTPQPQLVILDTDIGDDIDDAFALALVLKSPELKLLGVTTEFGDTEMRARLVERYLGVVGRSDISVAAGVPTKTDNVMTQGAYAEQKGGALSYDFCMQRLLSVNQAPVPKYEQDRYDACEMDRHDAVGFILKVIKENPGEITLICIGPLFNVQAAIAKDPETFKELKRVVLMGGSVYRGYGAADAPPQPEWNILCDPDGLTALLGSGVQVFMMPLDSTQIHLDQKAQATIFSHGSALTDQLTLLYHEWSGAGEWKTPTLFDPVAVTYAIRPDLCPATAMRIEVDAKGSTLPVAGAPNAQVCLKSDEQGFLGLLDDRLIQ
jgi:inosine-uridine nucleoside N-ribohydrolase